jgi:hypothetical protein
VSPNGLPEPQYPLLDRKDYKITQETVISLCVVDTGNRKELRLYKWRKYRGIGEWRVAKANLSLMDVNLARLSRDAKQLATKYGLILGWPIDDPGRIENLGEPLQPAAGAQDRLPEQNFLRLLRELFGDRIPSDAELEAKADELTRKSRMMQTVAEITDAIIEGREVTDEDVKF